VIVSGSHFAFDQSQVLTCDSSYAFVQQITTNWMGQSPQSLDSWLISLYWTLVRF